MAPQGPFLLTWFNSYRSMETNYIYYKVWDEITYTFLNFNGAIFEA